MREQADGRQPCARKDEQERVEDDRDPGMERMKPDTATARIVDGRGEQMIEIHGIHGAEDDETPAERLPIEDGGDRDRNEEVRENVEQGRAALRSARRIAGRCRRIRDR